jgi:hypothetical protein
MAKWEDIMGDDDDFGEIDAELDLVAGMGTAEIVGEHDETGDEDLLHALSIGAARPPPEGERPEEGGKQERVPEGRPRRGADSAA